MKPIPVILVFCLGLLVSCSPDPSALQDALNKTQSSWTSIPSLTPYATYTPLPTYTNVPTIAVEVTRLILVTITPTPTPFYTPTITPLPSLTSTVTQTPNISQTVEAQNLATLRANKGDGFYLVSVDIAPGVWRSSGSGDGCYWAVTSRTGDIIDNHFGMSGGTAFISPNGFQVEFSDCGTWEFLSPP